MPGNDHMSTVKNRESILFFIGCCILAIGIIVSPHKMNEASYVNLSEYSSVNAICELATLKNFYHNVVMYEKEPDGGNRFVNDVLLWPFGGFAKVGYKQFWMEYSGIVEAGIDAGLIRISDPDPQGVVEIYVPDAKVINVYAAEKSLTEPLTERGWFTKITGKEKTEAFSSAQSAMRREAENDLALLRRAKENAKVLLERYVVNTGNGMGRRLSVKWINTP
ncbi:MAG: DUF4230 domain-containing protein [Clostridia bacterium]|nr:DUF4230 domain-containing protein [Clostridia bacterium]